MLAGKKDYEEFTEKLVNPILIECKVELYDIEYVKEGSDYYLRVFIDKEGGVTIDDCENVSRALSDKLDEKDYINEAYILEVSSPGLGRTLKKDKHFEKSIGEIVDIKLYEAIDGQKEFSGALVSFDKENLTIAIDDKDITLKRSMISVVKLALDF